MEEQTITNRDIWEAARERFDIFVEEIIGLRNAEFHDELDANIGNRDYKKIAITFPRGHGKSTHISVMYPLWEIAENHNVRILLISSTAQIAKSFMTEIIGHIERNDGYKDYSKYVDITKNKQVNGVIPKMKNYKAQQENWAGDSIIIDRNDLSVKDPTINALGLFGSILSKRADIIICDDIVNQENSATEAQRLKVIDWIYTTVMPVLVPGGRFIYLGNTWHQDDLVSRLLKDPQFEYRKRMPSIIKEADRQDLWQEWAQILLNETSTIEERRATAEAFYQEHKFEMDAGVQLLWPQRFSYKDLYLMRLANPYSFARMYQCDPSNRPDQKFKDEWLEAAVKKGSHLKLQDEPRENLMMELTTSGLDLAISEESTADDTALLTIDRVKFGNALIHAGDVVLRNIDRGKKSPNTVRLMVKAHADKVQPDGIRVESVAYQMAMVKDLADLGIAGIRAYQTGKEKKDPDVGINSLAILAELGKLVLPFDPSDPRTIMEVSRLMNEMRAWPDGHTGDSLMALWFAYSEMRDLSGDKILVPLPAAKSEVDPHALPVDVRQAEEKKADIAKIREQEYERSNFNRMMGVFK